MGKEGGRWLGAETERRAEGGGERRHSELGRKRRVLTTLHVVDEILFQSVPADVGIAVVEITVPFAAVFAAELLRFSAGDGVERVSFPDRHRGRRLLSEAGGSTVGLQQEMGVGGQEGWGEGAV